MDHETLLRLREVQRRELRNRSHEDPAGVFRWHDIQQFVLDGVARFRNGVRIMLVAGGNRGGKTATGMGVISQMLRRASPINQQLRTTDRFTGRVRTKNDKDPLTIWVVPPTLEKARQDWLTPQNQMGLKYWCGHLFLDHRETPDNIIYSRPPGLSVAEMYADDGKLIKEKCDKLVIKAHGQDLLTFESSEVDLVVFDEEIQDERIWNSVLMRIATTNGVVMMTYTPLHGLSWSWKRYWRHLITNGAAKRVAERCWIFDPKKGASVLVAQMGSRDNPKAREYADEIESDPEMTDAEKAARLYGEYGYVEGALIRSLSGIDLAHPTGKHRQYIVDKLPGQKDKSGQRVPGKIIWWGLVVDPNKSYGGLLSCLDQDDNLYFVAEHLEESWPDRRHAQAFKAMERAYATGHVNRYADPGSAGAQSIINLADSGLYFQAVPKGAGSVSASVKKLRGRTYVDKNHAHPITGAMGAPRVYFYRPGMLSEREDAMGRMSMTCALAEQINQARQTDNENAPPDTPHKDIRSKLDLFDCARYTAWILSEVSVGQDEEEGRRTMQHDTIPTDASRWKNNRGDFDPLNPDWEIPAYDFGGGEVWM